jgi:hypothetical protein
MPHFNLERKEIAFKIVYFGPGESGKTTNLIQIHRAVDPERRGDLLTLDTAEERTLFFDFFPLDLGQFDGYSVRFNMYTVPGQVYYEASRRLILDGADGVVFVADSQMARYEENVVSFRLMTDNLLSYDQDPDQFPMVLQYNKRDIASPIPLGSLEETLALKDVPVLEAVAVNNQGVLETIRSISRRVIERFQI